MRGPFPTFNYTLNRCYRLTDHYRTQLKEGRPGQHLADVLRGTLVLACAALDAFNVGLLTRALPRAQRQGQLAGAAPTKKQTRELVKDLRRSAGPPLPDRVKSSLRWITLQRPDAIEELVVNVLGASDPWSDAAAELTRLTRRTWTAVDVRSELDALVTRRDSIVHRADASPGGDGSLSIRVRTVEGQLLLVLEVGRAIRNVINSRI